MLAVKEAEEAAAAETAKLAAEAEAKAAAEAAAKAEAEAEAAAKVASEAAAAVVEDVEVIGGVESEDEKEDDAKVESDEEDNKGASGLKSALEAKDSSPELDSDRPE